VKFSYNIKYSYGILKHFYTNMHWTVSLLAVIHRTLKNAKQSILYKAIFPKKWSVVRNTVLFKVPVNWHKYLPASVKVIVTMCSVNIWLCVQGQWAGVNLCCLWDIMYWNREFWDSISVTLYLLCVGYNVLERSVLG